MYDAVKNDKVLICDELEAFLHPNLICKIVEIFSTVLSKESNAQLITTTHCLDVLNIKSLRRDQVYFTDFKKDRSTELYSLDNIKGVRKTEDFRRFYRHGDYGAIPTYTDDFIHRVCEFVFSKKST